MGDAIILWLHACFLCCLPTFSCLCRLHCVQCVALQLASPRDGRLVHMIDVPHGDLELPDWIGDSDSEDSGGMVVCSSSNGSGASDVDLASDSSGEEPARPAAPLPPLGQSTGGAAQKSIPPLLPRAPSLGIRLQQVPVESGGERWSAIIEPGREPLMNGYSTLRRFPGTHYTRGGLTVRNNHDLPLGLFLDPAFFAETEAVG